MNPKMFALAACLIIGSTCAQDNQGYDRLHTGLNDFGIGSGQNVGTSLNSTELSFLPRLDTHMQNLIDDSPDNSSIPIPLRVVIF